MSSFIRTQGRGFFFSNPPMMGMIGVKPPTRLGTTIMSSISKKWQSKPPTVLKASLLMFPTGKPSITSLGKNLKTFKSSILSDLFIGAKKSYSNSTRKMATYEVTGRTRTSNGFNNSKWSKIKHPLLFTIIFCGVSTLLTPYLQYVPPFQYFRKHPDHLIFTIMGINTAVFGLWRIGNSQIVSRLYKYGLLHKDSNFNYFSMIGSAFSHQQLFHLAANMLCFYSFSTTILRFVGPEFFTTMYLNSAVFSSLTSFMAPILTGGALIPSLGASGAIYAFFGTFSYLIPHAKLALFFIPLPVGAWVVFLCAMGFEFSCIVLKRGIFDHAGHLGGAISGIFYGWWIKKKYNEQQKRREAERLRIWGR